MFNDDDVCPICGSSDISLEDEEYDSDTIGLTEIRRFRYRCDRCGNDFQVNRYIGTESLYMYGDGTDIIVIDGASARRDAKRFGMDVLYETADNDPFISWDRKG